MYLIDYLFFKSGTVYGTYLKALSMPNQFNNIIYLIIQHTIGLIKILLCLIFYFTAQIQLLVAVRLIHVSEG